MFKGRWEAAPSLEVPTTDHIDRLVCVRGETEFPRGTAVPPKSVPLPLPQGLPWFEGDRHLVFSHPSRCSCGSPRTQREGTSEKSESPSERGRGDDWLKEEMTHRISQDHARPSTAIINEPQFVTRREKTRWILGIWSTPPPAPYGPPELAPASPPRPESPARQSTASPPRRRRGRPPGTKKLAAIADAAKLASKKPKAKPATTTKNGAKKKNGGSKPRWSDAEKTQFFSFLLAFDEIGDQRFEQHQKNPNYVYKRASELHFAGKCSLKSIKGLYTRSIETFTWMVAFESFTGNGGGDPDSDDPTAILKGRLLAARKAGLCIGSLKPDTITAWQNNGCLGTSAKVTREVVRNSASALYDLEDDSLLRDSDDNIEPLLLAESRAAQTSAAPKTPAPRKNAAAIVSEPKHTPASHFCTQATSSLANLGEFMKIKMVSEEKKTKAFEAKLELDHAKLQLEREKAKVDAEKAKVEMARNVFSMDGASDEVKAAANKYLLSLFD
ncbi:hypothetical protein DFH09DRAFT_1483219 [Mycena vulgaris]|nr:hypothetical protein DFH09DRAFT_1483219 [Mycena vulgaris]